MPLSPRHAAFVAEYLANGLNATKACVAVGYSPKTAESQGCRLLKRKDVASAIAEASAKRAAKLELTADVVLQELMRIGLCDIGQAFDVNGALRPIHEIPEDVRRAIAGIEVDELYAGGGENRIDIGQTRKVKFWNKPEALVALGKHLKLFVEQHDHNIRFRDMTDEQLEKRAREIAKGWQG